MAPTTTKPNVTAGSLLPLNPSIENYHTCTHLISSYILPDLLHFLAYLLGFWYFRVQDNEQMDALIQQVRAGQPPPPFVQSRDGMPDLVSRVGNQTLLCCRIG